MTAIITLKQLTDARACSEQVALFEATFGDSVNVTVARARKVSGLFDWDFAVRFLDDEGKAAYEAAVAPADAAYKAARATAYAAYEAATATAAAAYDAATATAYAAYKAARATAWASAYIATCKRAKVAV